MITSNQAKAKNHRRSDTLGVLIIAFLLLAVGCNDAGPTSMGRPELIRSCGELVGVEPVEPVVLYEDPYGCPTFDPVPCTQPREYYDAVCGDCWAGSAVNADGDEWVPGCLASCVVFGPDGSEGPFFICNRGPESGEMLWSAFGNCASLYERMVCTWPVCGDDEPLMGPPTGCP